MKTIVCVFAHPDDESFGPGGTIAKLARKNGVYIICVTDGDAGQTTYIAKEKLGKERRKEMQKAAGILGVKKIFFLGYHDGTLCNNLYHEIAEEIKKILKSLHPEMLLTFEMKGVTGHLDHIAVAMMTTFVFHKLSFVKQVWFYSNSKALSDVIKNYFIYLPMGCKRSEADKIIDVTDVWDQRIKAMRAHKSQLEDMEKVFAWLKQVPKEEYFYIMKKE